MKKYTIYFREEIKVSLRISSELQNFISELGYPFTTLSSLFESKNLDKYLDSKWIQSAHIFEILDKNANDQQLLTCSNVQKFYQFIPPYFAALSSKNGQQAISRLASYEQLIGPIEIGTFKEGDKLRIHIGYLNQYRKISRFSLLVDQLSIISLIRTGTGKEVKPISIGSRFEYSQILTNYIGIQAQMSSDNYLVFKLEDLLIPFKTQNDIVWNFMEPGLKKYIDELNVNPPFSAVVQNVLFKLIAGGNFQVKDVAEEIGISSRTLQRWLGKEGTTFKKELGKVQKVLSLNLLQDATMKTAEVSFLVGFTDVTSFYKAFKKWTGKTVLTYRHEVIYRKNQFNSTN